MGSRDASLAHPGTRAVDPRQPQSGCQGAASGARERARVARAAARRRNGDAAHPPGRGHRAGVGRTSGRGALGAPRRNHPPGAADRREGLTADRAVPRRVSGHSGVLAPLRRSRCTHQAAARPATARAARERAVRGQHGAPHARPLRPHAQSAEPVRQLPRAHADLPARVGERHPRTLRGSSRCAPRRGPSASS